MKVQKVMPNGSKSGSKSFQNGAADTTRRTIRKSEASGSTCLSKGTGSAVYVEAVRLFSFSWILVIFWMAHYNEKTCWYMSLRGAASCCL